jgi:hypothetical protein
MSTHFGPGRFLRTQRFAVGGNFIDTSFYEPTYHDVSTYEWTIQSDGTANMGESLLARFGPPNMSKAPQDQMERDYLFVKEAIRMGQFADDMRMYPMIRPLREALFRVFGED